MKIFGMSLREAEILQMSLLGLSEKEIAETLNIEVRTVKYHRGRIYDHLGLKARAGHQLRSVRDLFGNFEVEVKLRWVPKPTAKTSGPKKPSRRG